MPRSNMPSSENINMPRSFSERSHTSLSDSPRLGIPNSSRPGANRKRAPQTRKSVNWRVVSGLTVLLLIIPYVVISLAFSQSSGALGTAVANSLNNQFGFASWMVPILLGTVSAALLETTKGQKYSLKWFLPLMLVSSLLMASKLGHRGGIWGTAIDNAVTHFVGDAGAWILVLGSLFFAFILLWQLTASQVQYGLKTFSEWVQVAAIKAGQIALKWLKIFGKFLFVLLVWAGTQIVKLWRASLAKGREKWEERKQAKAYNEDEDFEYIDDYYDDEVIDDSAPAPFSFDDFNNNEVTARYGSNNIQNEPVYSERYDNAARENPLNPFDYGSRREPGPAVNDTSKRGNDLEGTSVFTGDMLGRARQEEFVSEMVTADAGLSKNPVAVNCLANNAPQLDHNNCASSKSYSVKADNNYGKPNDTIASALLEEPSGISVNEPGTLNFNDIFVDSDKEGVKPVSRPVGRSSGTSAFRQNKGCNAPVESLKAPAEADAGAELHNEAPQAMDNRKAGNSGEKVAAASSARASKPKMSYQDAMLAFTGRRSNKTSAAPNKSASGESLKAPAEPVSGAELRNDAPQAINSPKAGNSEEKIASASSARASKPKMSYQDAMLALTGRRSNKTSAAPNKSASGELLKAPAEPVSGAELHNEAPQAIYNHEAGNSGEKVASASSARASKPKMSYQDALFALTGRRPNKTSAAPNKSASGESLKAPAEPAAGAELRNDAPQAINSPKAGNSGEKVASASSALASKPKMSYQDALFALTGRRPSKTSATPNKSASGESLKAPAEPAAGAGASQATTDAPPSSERADISKLVRTRPNKANSDVSAEANKHNAGSTLSAASALLSPGQNESSQVSLSGLADSEVSVEMLAVKAADMRQAAKATKTDSTDFHDADNSVSHTVNVSAKESSSNVSGVSNNIANAPRMNPQGELKRDEEREKLKKRSPEEFLNSIGISVRPKKIGGMLNSTSAHELPTTIVQESSTMESSEQEHVNGSHADNANSKERAYKELRHSLGLSECPAVAPKPVPPAQRPAAAAPKPAALSQRPAAVAPKPVPPTQRPAAAAPKPAAPSQRPAAVAPKPAATAPRPETVAPMPAAPVYEKPADTPAFLEITRRTPNQQNNAGDSSDSNKDVSSNNAVSAPKPGLVPKSLSLKPGFAKQLEDRSSRERYSPLMAKQMMPKPGLSALLPSKPMLDRTSSKPMLDKAQSKPVLDKTSAKPVLEITSNDASMTNKPGLEQPAHEKPVLALPHQEMPKLELSALERNGSLANNPVPSNAISAPGSRGGLKIGSLFKDFDDASSVHDASGEYEASGDYEVSGEYYEDGEYVSGEYEASGEYYDSQEYDESCEYDAEDEHIVTDELEYELPPLDLLNDGNGLVCRKSENKSEALLEVLKSFRVEATLHNIVHGPAVTRYELKPAKGVSVKKFTNLQDDIALALAAKSLRIEAPVPGRPVVGIEVPNDSTELVALKDILDSDSFCSGRGLRVGLGKDITGYARTTDLVKMPHLLVAGTTGSGKSVCINTIILSLLYKFTPKHLQLLMIDPKQVELSIYKGIPHLIGLSGEEAGQIITDPKKAEAALRQAVELMETRYTLLAANNVRNIDEYNAKVDDYLPWVVIIIDELADLMMVAAKSIEVSICRLAQKARAAGIHLVVATQRPSTDVITGLMKVNIPSRIAFAVSSQVDSRVILDMNGAEHLLGKGDMLFKSVDSFDAVRIQGAFVTNEEIERVVEFWRSQGTPDNKIELDITEPEPEEPDKEAEEVSSGDEELVKQALELILKKQQASASMLQTGLRIGYARARRVIEILEERGYVGPAEGSKPRKIYYTGEES